MPDKVTIIDDFTLIVLTEVRVIELLENMDGLPARFLRCQSLLQCEAGYRPGHHVHRPQVYNAEDTGR